MSVLYLQNRLSGRVPEWPKGADCKSVIDDFEGSNPSPPISLFETVVLPFFAESTCNGPMRVDSAKNEQNKDFK